MAYIRHFLLITFLIYKVNLSECADSFQDIINSMKNFISGLTNSFRDLPAFTRNIANTLSAAIDEDCVFKCPNGRNPKSNPYHFPEGNGCGVPGLQIPRYIPITDLEDCCKEHDICYGTCNKNKDECDEKFKKCLYKICSHFEKMISKELLSGCKIVAKTLYTAVMAMGCKYYLNAQNEACICDVNYYKNEF